MNTTPTPRTDNIFACSQYGKIEYALFAMQLERELASVTAELLALRAERDEAHADRDKLAAKLANLAKERSEVTDEYLALRARNAEQEVAISQLMARLEAEKNRNTQLLDAIDLLQSGHNGGRDFMDALALRDAVIAARAEPPTPAPTLDDAAEADLYRVRGIGARHDSEMPDAMGGTQ